MARRQLRNVFVVTGVTMLPYVLAQGVATLLTPSRCQHVEAYLSSGFFILGAATVYLTRAVMRTMYAAEDAEDEVLLRRYTVETVQPPTAQAGDE